MPVDEMHQPVRQVARKIWSEITRPILQKAAGHIHPGPFLVCQLDVGISFVIAQQNVEARLPLLDQVVLKRQRLLFIGDGDVIQIARF